MSTRLKDLFSPLIIESEDPTRSDSMLNAIVWTALTLTLLLIPFFLLVSAPLTLFGILVSMFLVELGTLYLMHNRRIKEAGILLTFAGWVVLFLPAFFQGGLASPFTLYSVVMVAIAVLLLGSGYGILLGSLTVAALLIMLLLGNWNLLPEWIPTATPGQHWLNLIIVLGAVGALSLLAVRRLRASATHAREIELHLEESSRDLETTRSTLEEAITERTSHLERRTQQLQAELEIASAIATTRDLDTLLGEIISLICGRLGYHYASIFLADRSGQSLVLRASNTETGKRMIERGFTLKTGQTSVVGNAADTLRSQLVTGVTLGAVFLQDEGFPEIESLEIGSPESREARSELAMPLISGGKLLGVLDIQSSKSETMLDISSAETQTGSEKTPGFDPESVAILQPLVENIAVAIENTQLLTEKQQTVEAIQRAYSSMSKETWQKLLRSQPEFGYLCSMAGDPVITTGAWSPEMLQARDTGEVIRANEFTLAIPIKIREQVAGVVKLRKPEATGGWSEEEIDLVETLSERLSTALESAQLYDETRRRAERERLTGEITARVRASNDPQIILQTAVSELRRALKADHAQLLVRSSPGQTKPGPRSDYEPLESSNPARTEDHPTEHTPTEVYQTDVESREGTLRQGLFESDDESDSHVQSAS